MTLRDYLQLAAITAPGFVGAVSSLFTSAFETRRARLFAAAFSCLLALCVGGLLYEGQRLSQASDIEFTFGDGGPFTVEVAGKIYSRILVTNKSDQDAICSLRLTDIENLDDHKILIRDENIFLAAGNTGNHGWDEQLIGPKYRIPFDVAYIQSDKDDLLVQSRGDSFYNVYSGQMPHGDYKFTVRTNGKNCVSDPYEVVVRYQGWRNLKIVSGKTAPVEVNRPPS